MELFDLYTNEREKTGKTVMRGEPIPKGFYHVTVHICVFRDDKMLIQRRQPFKEGWSGMWDVSAGGSAVSGETSHEAAQRELFEELGLDLQLPDRPHITVHFDHGFDDIYIVEHSCDISELVLQETEVWEAKWADIHEIMRMIDEGEFIPYHKGLITTLFAMRIMRGTFTRNEENTGKSEGSN